MPIKFSRDRKVRSSYTPADVWSKVGKRLCRSLLGLQPPIAWAAVMGCFRAEFDGVEEDFGCLTLLEVTGKSASEFLVRLTHPSEPRSAFGGGNEDAEHGVSGESGFAEVKHTYSAAVMLKACLELGRLTLAPQVFFLHANRP